MTWMMVYRICGFLLLLINILHLAHLLQAVNNDEPIAGTIVGTLNCIVNCVTTAINMLFQQMLSVTAVIHPPPPWCVLGSIANSALSTTTFILVLL
jgi:hypothetical protein